MLTIPDLKALTEPGFCGVVAEMISEARSASICGKYEPVARRPRKRETSDLVMDSIHHQIHQDGALAVNAAQLGGEPISDWAYAQRQALLPVELFGEHSLKLVWSRWPMRFSMAMFSTKADGWLG